jgi:putative glutamine amidotransferase
MKPAKPLIGIPCYHDKSSSYSQSPVNAQFETYLSAISQAGGIPFLIPLNLERLALRQLYDLSSGILLAGGGDIDLALYGQTPQTKLYSVQPDRDQLEMTLSRWAADEGKPTLGICRGIQVMAVAAGGTLCQDLPTQKPTATLHNYIYQTEGTNAVDHLAHEVEFTSTSRLAQILQTNTMWVNSLHHQAVESVPAPLQITGCSSDGVVEVIEHPEHPFFYGVQWHPELLVAAHQSARRIFEAFVAVCANDNMF